MFHSINLGNFTPTAQEMDLAQTMVLYWTNFARQGNPNDFGPSQTLLDWPSYYVDKTTGTKQAQCLRFKTPGNEVGGVHVCVCVCVRLWYSYAHIRREVFFGWFVSVGIRVVFCFLFTMI